MNHQREANNDTLRLIQLVDEHYKVRLRVLTVKSPAFLGGLNLLAFVLLVNLLLAEPTGVSVVTLVAIFSYLIGFWTFVFPMIPRSVIRDNFGIMSKFLTDSSQEKFLFALIKMKVTEPDINLEDVYKADRSMFTEKELLKKLYEI